MRPDIHQYGMMLAFVAATRSSCPRRSVGAVIMDERGRVMSTGYNGSPFGVANCTTIPCAGADKAGGATVDDCIAIHAEVNAIASCSNLRDAVTLYTTTQPCMSCMKALLATNISTIIYGESYKQEQAIDLWILSGRYAHGFKDKEEFQSTANVFASLAMVVADRLT